MYNIVLYLKYLPQQNCLKSECTVGWDFNAAAVWTCDWYSLWAYGFTSSRLSKCLLRWIPLCTLRWPDSTNYKSPATITTFKRFQSTVNSAVLNKMSWLCKSFATNSSLEWFLSTVNSMPNKVTWPCKSFATNSTFKRFHSAMTSPVYCHLCTTFTAFCHILCTCIYPYEYSHEDAGFVETRNVSHTHYTNICFI